MIGSQFYKLTELSLCGTKFEFVTWELHLGVRLSHLFLSDVMGVDLYLCLLGTGWLFLFSLFYCTSFIDMMYWCVQPSDFITVMLVPDGGEIEVDLENLAEMGIVRVVSFYSSVLFLFSLHRMWSTDDNGMYDVNRIAILPWIMFTIAGNCRNDSWRKIGQDFWTKSFDRGTASWDCFSPFTKFSMKVRSFLYLL